MFRRREDKILPEYAIKILIISLSVKGEKCLIIGIPGHSNVIDLIISP
jgi:hypothetical protein